jgi:hypothetical protein
MPHNFLQTPVALAVFAAGEGCSSSPEDTGGKDRQRYKNLSDIAHFCVPRRDSCRM